MPHRIIFIVSFCLISFKSFCQNTYIPDANFEQTLINLGYDTLPIDNSVPTENINKITNLYLLDKGISDLTGIEDFKALTNLDCSFNKLTNIDVSSNLNLTELYCNDNLLTNINISKNLNLIRLWCFKNKLTNLDISNNDNLISLRCEDNLLNSLHVTNLKKLNVLTFERNYISSIDVSNNTILNRLECGQNLLESLNVEANTNLSYLSCEENQLKVLNVNNNNRLGILICANNQISKLNISKNTKLTNLDARYNDLCQLNLKNGNNSNMFPLNFSDNPNLNCVVVDNPNANHTTWEPTSFKNYVDKIEDCSNFIYVDNLQDYTGKGYTLPTLSNGHYFSEPNGNGTPLNPGDYITTSQTIYIYNQTACFSNESSFNVLITESDFFVPKYFTPNNDSNNDVWKVTDNTNIINNITIYDRHGKLIKFLASNSNGWDGTFNGQLLPTDSYWYVIVLNTKEIIKGHFALKR
ncbi:T9SS type B sorting domain-containing protein [Flavobacteriaceae bacterium GSB9]|nr:T9SS type B sorting domain-containing protein [Flavobacteriaceae bacterium GSB9]